MANLIDINVNQLAAMIACVHIMDVIIFQKMVACIYLLSIRLCILCLLSRIGGRGKGSKHTRCLECIYFTIFGFSHGAYITAVTEAHVRVHGKALLALRSQTRHIHPVLWVFLSIFVCFVLTCSFCRK